MLDWKLYSQVPHCRKEGRGVIESGIDASTKIQRESRGHDKMDCLVERYIIFIRWSWATIMGEVFSSAARKTWLNEICCYKFSISHQETGLHLTFSFTSYKMEFNPLTITYVGVSKQLLLTVYNIFKVTALTYFSVSKDTEKEKICFFCYTESLITLIGS